MEKKKRYEKVFVVDTNIILNDHESLELLSENSSNLIVIPETVLDEIDAKKTGLEEINYQARAFGRLLATTFIQEVDKNDQYTLTKARTTGEKNITFLIVSKHEYESDKDNSTPSIINDRKILEIAKYIEKLFENVIFISNDTMARFRGISLGIRSEPLYVFNKSELRLEKNLRIEYPKDYINIKEIDVPKETQTLRIWTSSGEKIYYRSGDVFKLINEDVLVRQNIKPKNYKQKVLSSMMLDENIDIVLSDSPAGSGKTILALSNAMRLLDTNRDKYEKIVYIRKTVISDTEELGFLPGTLEEKMEGFLAPLYSNLEYIIEKKYKKLTKEELNNKIKEFIDKYRIQVLYEGHLRGGNIRNAVVILDEFQNNSISSAKTILSRIGENCKVFVIGSTRQIDSKYLNSYNNALTYLLNKLKEENEEVSISACNLNKTVRSKIAEWADTFK